MEQKITSTKITTPIFRVSFPHVFEPVENQNHEKKYSIVMLFDKSHDLTVLKQAVAKAIVDRWGSDKTKWPKGLRNPLRDGEEKVLAGYPEYAGTIFCTASSKVPPGIVDGRLQAILDKNEFYSGCWARATVVAFAYDKSGNRGVAFGLNNIQKVKDDTPFTARTKAENDFKALEETTPDAAAVTEEDPLDGLN